MATLVISLPDGSDETHELRGDKITLGRLDDNDIQISDVSVSSHHAEFILNGNEYEVMDLRSTNGTYIKGERVDRVKLTPGTEMHFGIVHAVYSPVVVEVKRPLPEAEIAGAMPASESRCPGGFVNASPFQSKEKAKDKQGAGIKGLAFFSMMVFLGAVVLILLLQAPQ